jgi:hypothetical protein
MWKIDKNEAEPIDQTNQSAIAPLNFCSTVYTGDNSSRCTEPHLVKLNHTLLSFQMVHAVLQTVEVLQWQPMNLCYRLFA